MNDDKGMNETGAERDEQGAAAGEQRSDQAHVGQGSDIVDPRPRRQRSWSVEVLLRSGRSERETVKAPTEADTYRYARVADDVPIVMLVVEGEGALINVRADDVTMIRVSKGA
jgi:hypothetical protein